MTTGALIFAFNNEQTDYVAMAEWSARRIRRHLDIPVAVVTDVDPGDPRVSGFNRVIAADAATGGTRWFEDYAKTVSWHNAGRVDAYSLTPWDRTLVLDADYVVCSSTLKTLLTADTDFLCHKNAWDTKNGQPLDGLNTFGRYHMPMWWATVMMFRKSNTAQYIFDSMQMVRNHWQHYRDLYHIDRSTYRNDFALSIALGIVSGHTGHVDEIPWDLASVLPDTKLTQLDEDYFALEYVDPDGVPRTVGISATDFHAMGKAHLEKIIASC
jgi:hypothetical protein